MSAEQTVASMQMQYNDEIMHTYNDSIAFLE